MVTIWGELTAEELADRSKAMTEDTIKNGGATRTLTLLEVNHEHGYYVSVNGYETRTTAEDLVSVIMDYSKLAEERLDTSNGIYFIGTWEHGGKYYVDYSRWIGKLYTAVNYGVEQKQRSIFDIEDGKAIMLN